MRVLLALSLVAFLGACDNYGTPASHWPPLMPPDDAGSVTHDDGGSGGADAAVPPASDGGGNTMTDGGTGGQTDGGTPTCDQDRDDCVLKCKKDHDDRDKDNDDHWKQCLAGDPKLHSKDPDFCNREDRDRRQQCKDQDTDCVLKCKKDQDDCKKGGR